MKKIFFTTSLILLFVLIFFIIVLSTVGYETNKFNRIISKKINENNQHVLLRLDKIRFKFDIKDISLFLETKNLDIRKTKIAEILNTYTYDLFDNTTLQ